MIDLKKVIKGLECCLDDYGIDSNCSECPYAEKDVVRETVRADIERLERRQREDTDRM